MVAETTVVVSAEEGAEGLHRIVAPVGLQQAGQAYEAASAGVGKRGVTGGLGMWSGATVGDGWGSGE